MLRSPAGRHLASLRGLPRTLGLPLGLAFLWGSSVVACADPEARTTGASVAPPGGQADTPNAPVAASPDEAAPEPDAEPGASAEPTPDAMALDTSCTRNRDCEAAYGMSVADNGACCRGCGTVAATASSLERAEAECAARGSEGCPMKKCVALAPVACVQGQCVVRE